MGRKLTKASVEALEPREKAYFVWDADLKGFGVKVLPSGRKSYVVQYRLPGQRNPPREAIGYHGSPYTVQEARKEAQRKLLLASQGSDPREERRSAANSGLAFDAYAEFFIENYLRENWPGSFAQSVSLIRSRAIPFFGSKPITEISKRDAAEWIDSMREQRATARRAAEVVGKLFRWAEDRGVIEQSPMDRVPRPKPSPGRERYLQDAELRDVWDACKLLQHPYGALLRMLILTGQRRGEVGGMRWDEIDLDEKLWVVPKGRTKSGRVNAVPLTPMMIELLDEMPKLGSLVFTVSGDRPLGNHSKLKARLDQYITDKRAERDVGPLPHWTVHDLRRTVAVGLQRLGVPRDIVEVVESRVPRIGAGRTYQRYDYLDEKRQALTEWDRHVSRAVEADENVGDLQRLAPVEK